MCGEEGRACSPSWNDPGATSIFLSICILILFSQHFLWCHYQFIMEVHWLDFYYICFWWDRHIHLYPRANGFSAGEGEDDTVRAKDATKANKCEKWNQIQMYDFKNSFLIDFKLELKVHSQIFTAALPTGFGQKAGWTKWWEIPVKPDKTEPYSWALSPVQTHLCTHIHRANFHPSLQSLFFKLKLHHFSVKEQHFVTLSCLYFFPQTLRGDIFHQRTHLPPWSGRT